MGTMAPRFSKFANEINDIPANACWWMAIIRDTSIYLDINAIEIVEFEYRLEHLFLADEVGQEETSGP